MDGYFLTILDSDVNHAGSKALKDVDQILHNESLLGIYVDGEQPKWERRLFFKSNLSQKLDRANKFDLFVVQYPFYSGRYAAYQITKQVTSKYKNSVILIHDIASLRGNNVDKKLLEKEIWLFNHYKFIIAHNESMANFLKKNGCTSNIVSLGVFDYLSNDIDTKKENSYKRVFFAGNLAKSDFLYNPSIKSNYEVYGVNLKNKKHDFKYEGVQTPEHLSETLSKENGFGLVWEGNSIDYSSNYTKINDPHKASLYLSCNMPLIVWSKSALADFVINNKIGFAVDNLSQVNDLLDDLSEEKYKELQANTRDYGKKVRSGYFLTSALNKIQSISHSKN